MRRFLCLVVVLALGSTISGCSILAPQYSASIENVQTLKDAGDIGAKVGKFDSSGDRANPSSISLRGSSLGSPYGGSYATYLAEAIKQELSLAGKLQPGTDIEISGVLLKNDIDASGFSRATGDLEARFLVRRGDAVLYEQVKAIHYDWDSSFAGAVAIPRAQQEYPRMVQRLLGELYADKAFLGALK